MYGESKNSPTHSCLSLWKANFVVECMHWKKPWEVWRRVFFSRFSFASIKIRSRSSCMFGDCLIVKLCTTFRFNAHKNNESFCLCTKISKWNFLKKYWENVILSILWNPGVDRPTRTSFQIKVFVFHMWF